MNVVVIIIIIIIIIILLCSDGFETRLKKFLLEDAITLKKKTRCVVVNSIIYFLLDLEENESVMGKYKSSSTCPVTLSFFNYFWG